MDSSSEWVYHLTYLLKLWIELCSLRGPGKCIPSSVHWVLKSSKVFFFSTWVFSYIYFAMFESLVIFLDFLIIFYLILTSYSHLYLHVKSASQVSSACCAVSPLCPRIFSCGFVLFCCELTSSRTMWTLWMTWVAKGFVFTFAGRVGPTWDHFQQHSWFGYFGL